MVFTQTPGARMIKKCFIVWMLTAVCALNHVYADAFHVIICGSGGEEEFIEKFQSWGERLERASPRLLGARGEGLQPMYVVRAVSKFRVGHQQPV